MRVVANDSRASSRLSLRALNQMAVMTVNFFRKNDRFYRRSNVDVGCRAFSCPYPTGSA
jgi:hypothetical protein